MTDGGTSGQAAARSARLRRTPLTPPGCSMLSELRRWSRWASAFRRRSRSTSHCDVPTLCAPSSLTSRRGVVRRQPPTIPQLAAFSRMGWLVARGRHAEAVAAFLRFAYSYRDGGSAWDAFPEEWRRAATRTRRRHLPTSVSPSAATHRRRNSQPSHDRFYAPTVPGATSASFAWPGICRNRHIPGYVARGTMLRCVRDVGRMVGIGIVGATYS